MRQRAFLTLAAAALWLLVAGAAVAQPLAAPSGDGQTIVRIEYRGLVTLAEETVNFYLGLEQGTALSLDELNDNLHALWKRQLIEDIEVTAVPEGEGVALVIELRERPVLRSIEYQGLKKIERSAIVERISSDRLRVREGDPLNLGDLRRLERSIEQLYGEKGFRLADAEFQIEEIGPGDRRVIYTIDEGDKVRIEDISFEGNTVYSDRRLRFAMKQTKEGGPVARVLKKDVYKPATFDEDLDKVRDIYRKIGYKNVVIGEPEVEVKATRPNRTESAQKRRLFLTIPIEEGARWRLGEITIDGNDQFSDELLLRVFDRPRGGWLRSKVVDEAVESISELYSNTGYIFARVEPQLIEKPEQVADLRVNIDEGDQYSIDRIAFEGNVKTKDKVLRRELAVQEQRVLNSGALKNSLLRIKQLQFFEVDEEDPVAFDFDTEEKTVDLTIRGQEGDRTELLFGGGFSEIDGFFGQFAFRSRNFLGRGETLGVSAQLGRRQDVFDLSYFVPWFLDRPQSVGLQVFRRDLEYVLITGQRVNQKTDGGTASYGRNYGLFRRVQLSYSLFSQEDLRRTGDVQQAFKRDVSTLRLSHTFDRRDSRLQPTVGMRYSLGFDYAGGFLGGTSSYIRPTAGFSMHRPISRESLLTVAAFNIEAGYIRPFDGDVLDFFDRYYLGGENSVRGFRFRSISLRDDNGNPIFDGSGFPVGGDSFLQFNFEYIFVLGGPFRLLTFFDAGGVFDTDFRPFDIDSLRMTSGAELQVNVPVFGAPLRFIYSINLEPLPDDRFESFQFSVGPSF